MAKKALIIAVILTVSCSVFSADVIFDIGQFIITGSAQNTDNDKIDSILIDEEQKIKTHSLNEIITKLPSVNLETAGKDEVIARIDGLNRRQYNVFIDGVPVYAVYDGYLETSHIPLSNIEEVSIKRGVSSILSGPDTLGPTLHIKTRKPRFSSQNFEFKSTPSSHNFSSYTYQNTDSKVNYYFNYTLDKRDYFELPKDFKGTLNQTAGKRDNSDFEKTLYHFIGGTKKGNTEHILRFSYYDNEKGIPVDVHTTKPRYWRFSEWNKKQLSYSSITTDKHSRKEFTFFVDELFNVLNQYDDATFTTQSPFVNGATPFGFKSTYDDSSYGLSFVPEFKKNNDIFSYMIYYKNDIHREQDDISDPWERYEASSYSVAALYNKENITSFGISYNKKTIDNANGAAVANDEMDSFTFSAEHNINHKSYIEFSQKTKFPTLKELYSGYLDSSAPNPDLKEEKADNFSYTYSDKINKTSSYKLRLFLNEIKNEILIVKNAVGTKSQNQNIGKTSYQGINFNYDKKIGKNNLNLILNYLDAENKTPGAVSVKVEYIPEFSSLLSYGINNNNNSLLVSLQYIGDRYHNPGSGFEKLDGYFTGDIGFSYTIWKNSGYQKNYINVKNINDKYYETKYGYPSEGRKVEFGISVNY